MRVAQLYPIYARGEILMFEDDINLAKRCCHCFEQMIKINDRWVRKIYCQRCPVCGHKLPGILTVDAVEICHNPRCSYRRRVFTLEERQQLNWKILPEELEPSPPQLPDEYEYIQQQLILGRWWVTMNLPNVNKPSVHNCDALRQN